MVGLHSHEMRPQVDKTLTRRSFQALPRGKRLIQPVHCAVSKARLIFLYIVCTDAALKQKRHRNTCFSVRKGPEDLSSGAKRRAD